MHSARSVNARSPPMQAFGCASSRCRHTRGARARFVGCPSAAVDAPVRPRLTGAQRSHETDVVVIGSGIGGLCCAGMLAKYGTKVTVLESHTIPGGAAHAWQQAGYHFESGPSLYSGMAGRGRAANPLAHVLQALGQELELLRYDAWNVLIPEGQFMMQVGNENFLEVAQRLGGEQAVREWRQLMEVMRPLAAASAMMPPAAFRYDPGVAVTAVLRYLPQLLQSGRNAAALSGPFSKVIEGTITHPFLRKWLDLLCFLLSGLPANGTIAAEVAYMFNEWYTPNCVLDFPKGGSQAMVDALVRGLEAHGGRLLLGSHVEHVIVDRGRAVGVALRGGGEVRARRAVISNASVWDTLRLLPEGAVPTEWREEREATPPCRSFMHLHLGLDADGLPPDLALHHIVVNRWEGGVDAEQNVVLVSIPSTIDPAMAPPGKHSLHAYLPATEPWARWEGLDRKSPEYAALKAERAEVLWDAVERVVPGVRERASIKLVGTPHTHARFLRRHHGSYGPALRAGEQLFPGPTTPLPGLYCCGDSTFPGIGLPAAAASGTIAANTLVPVWDHWKLLEEIAV